MIEITGFLLKHLYELMADDYNSARHSDRDRYRSSVSASSLASRIVGRNADSKRDTKLNKKLKRPPNGPQKSQSSDKLVEPDSGSQTNGEPFEKPTIRTTSDSRDMIYDQSQQSKDLATCERPLELPALIDSDTIDPTEANANSNLNSNAIDDYDNNYDDDDDDEQEPSSSSLPMSSTSNQTNACQWVSGAQSSDQEANQQIVLFLVNNHLPDLICETFIELLFLSVFVALTWIFVMVIQLHCQTSHEPAKYFYCNTKFLSALMYCNDKSHLSSY